MFSSANEAVALGTLGKVGIDFIGAWGGTGGGDFNALKNAYVSRYSQISKGSRNFIFYTGNDKQIKFDLDKIASVDIGRAVLAMIDGIVSVYKFQFLLQVYSSNPVIFQNQLEGGEAKPILDLESHRFLGVSVSYISGEFMADGVKTLSYITLAHELWHTLDWFSLVNIPNFVLKYDKSSYPKDPFPFSGQRLYSEIRAVDFQNQIANGTGRADLYRTRYSIDIRQYLGNFFRWYFQKP